MSTSLMSSDYPLPAITRMNALRQDFLDQINAASSVLLPVLCEQLNDLAEELLRAERLLSERVVSAFILLENHNWGSLEETLEESRRLSRPGDGQQDTGVCSREKDIERDAQRDFQRVEARGREVAEALQRLEAARLPEVSERINSLTGQRDKLFESITAQDAQIARMDERIQDIEGVINAFDAPNAMKLFKGLIPSEEEIDVLMKSVAANGLNPQLLKLASKSFLENLSMVIEGRKLVDVIKERNRLLGERNARGNDVLDWRARMAKVERELAQLPKIAVLQTVRSQWLEEARILSNGWSEHLRLMREQTSLAGLADALSRLAHYLLAVRRLYEAA